MFDYDNIGGKIKGVAVFTFVLGAIVMVLAGISLMLLEVTLLGILLIFIGPVFAWISSWLMYGFGQRIENSDISASQYKCKDEKHEENEEEKKNSGENAIKNPEAVQELLENPDIPSDEFIDVTCPNCKAELAYTKEYLEQGNVVCPMCDAHISI